MWAGSRRSQNSAGQASAALPLMYLLLQKYPQSVGPQHRPSLEDIGPYHDGAFFAHRRVHSLARSPAKLPGARFGI